MSGGWANLSGQTNPDPYLPTPPFAVDAELLVGYAERGTRHGATERFLDVDAVMATVTEPQRLTWSQTLCWAANAVESDGLPRAQVYTTRAQVRGFYADLVGREQLGAAQSPVTDVRSTWYRFMENLGTEMRNRETDAVRSIDSAVLMLFDGGGEGVSGEIGWNRCADVAVELGEAAERWTALLARLREQDVEALLALMSPTVQGAVRDYFDAEPAFVAINGRNAMRAYYEKFFERAEVLEVTPVRIAVRGWYVFAELRWTVRPRTGPETDRKLRFLTAEHLAFDSHGLFQCRFGYGTEME